MNFDKMSSNLGLNTDEYVELLEYFFPSAETDLKNLRAAHENGNMELASDAAHSLKGSSGNLGFMKLSECAKKVEEKTRNGDTKTIGAYIKSIDELVVEIKKVYNKYKNS